MKNKKIYIIIIILINLFLLVFYPLIINTFQLNLLINFFYVNYNIDFIFVLFILLFFIFYLINKKYLKKINIIKITYLILSMIYLISVLASHILDNNIKTLFILLFITINYLLIFLPIQNKHYYTYEKIFFFVILVSMIILNIFDYMINYTIDLKFVNFNIRNIVLNYFYFVFIFMSFVYFINNNIRIKFNFNSKIVLVSILFLLSSSYLSYILYMNDLNVINYFNKIYYKFYIMNKNKLLLLLINNLNLVIIEETIFRLYLMNYLLKKHNKEKAIIFNTLIFIFYHSRYIYSGTTIIFYIGCLFYSWFFYKYKNILLNILNHSLFNFIVDLII